MTPLQRTGWFPIVAVAIVGFGVGYLTQTALSASGRPPLVPPYSLPATLITVSAIVIGFAIPLRRAITGASKKRVNPFVAVRVVAAAKATIISGALFFGFGIGILLYFGLRTVAPEASAWWPVIVTAISGALQVAVGLVAEWLGRVPPTEHDTDEIGAEDGSPSNGGGPVTGPRSTGPRPAAPRVNGPLKPHTPRTSHPEARP